MGLLGDIGKIAGGLTPAGFIGSNIGGTVGGIIGNNLGGGGGTTTVYAGGGPKPIYPGWQDQREILPGNSLAEPNGLAGAIYRQNNRGLLKDVYQLKDPMADQRQGWRLLQEEATRTGPSAWRQAEEKRQMGALQQQGSSNLQSGLNRMAMTGGLRGGAAERMASQNQRQQLLSGQNVRAGLGAEDANRQWQAMQALPGAELAESQFQRQTQQYNIDKALQEQYQKRAAEMAKYSEQMRAWAAANTAAATPQSGGGFNLLDPSSWFG